MKKVISLILAAVLLLSLAVCGGTAAAAEAAVGAVSYTYTFTGMIGEETAQFDLYPDGTCRFYLPGNPMITDVYAAPYVREGDTVTVAWLDGLMKG